MNERIKELIEQAGFKTEAWLNLDGTPKATIYKEAIGGNNLEKFAELIVRECANVELYWLSMADRTGVLEKIYQHFGVE